MGKTYNSIFLKMKKAKFLGNSFLISLDKGSWGHLLLLLLLLHLVKPNNSLAQAPIVFPEKVKNFTTDKLGNVYALATNNQLVKYTPEGQEQFRYPNRTLGEASLLDATNPFHILLFFPQHQTVLLLDRTLNLMSQINLFSLGFQGVKTMGMASDGKLWVYDETSFLLKKINTDGTVVVESTDLSLAIGKPIRPVFLLEREQTVFLSDPNVGVLVFDVFGQYRKTIELQGLTSFQVMDEQLIYAKNGQLWSFHMLALLEKPYTLPFEIHAEAKVQLSNGQFYILENEVLVGHRI